MEDPREHPSLEQDVTKAIQRAGEHLDHLHRRLERFEQTSDETQRHWTTHGWEPPIDTDRRPGEDV